uniref:DCD domain-containing protein n=1 Tax=Heligmosomoides polygyrus TaxID=6339 RepID=A0A183GL55_HELPZ
LADFMRSAGYAGPYELPAYVTCVRKQLNPVSDDLRHFVNKKVQMPCPRGEEVAFGNIRGRRDYIARTIGVDADDLRQDWDAMEDVGRYQQRTAYVSFKASRVLRQSAASLSSSSHHMGPVPEQSMNMYNPQDQGVWIHDSQQNELQAGYENVGSYTAQSYTNVADSQVPNGVADVTSSGPIQEQQPVDQGAMENEAMAEINEFFVTNPYQHSENAENLRTAQMQSPPMSSYTAPVYKTEAPDYSFETAQLYEPVVTDGVFPQQPEQPVVRTAAGGECHGVMKMDTECFEQNEPITSNYQFNTAEFTYNMVQRMPIEQMKAVYLAGEQQQYQQPLGVHPSSSSEAVQHHNVEATTEYKVGEETKFDSSDEEWEERKKEEAHDKASARRDDSDTEKKSSGTEEVAEKVEASDSKERKEARRDSSSEKSRERRSDDRGSRKEEKSERPRDTDRRERREERSDRSRKDDERTDERRPKKYEDDDYEGPNKKARRDEFDSRRDDRDRGGRQWNRGDDRRRGESRGGRNWNERDRPQRKDDRHDYESSRRGNRGGDGHRFGGRGRNEDRDGGWRGKHKDREDNSNWQNRPSAEEIAKQKKLLWGGKSAQRTSTEGASESTEPNAAEASTSSSALPKNVGLWSSAITASGVAGEQANKFLKLMGIKNAAAVVQTAVCSEEKNFVL